MISLTLQHSTPRGVNNRNYILYEVIKARRSSSLFPHAGPLNRAEYHKNTERTKNLQGITKQGSRTSVNEYFPEG